MLQKYNLIQNKLTLRAHPFLSSTCEHYITALVLEPDKYFSENSHLTKTTSKRTNISDKPEQFLI